MTCPARQNTKSKSLPNEYFCHFHLWKQRLPIQLVPHLRGEVCWYHLAQLEKESAMQTHVDKNQKDQSRSVATKTRNEQSQDSTFQLVDSQPKAIHMRKLHELPNDYSKKHSFQFVDNRPEVAQTKRAQELANNSLRNQQLAQLRKMMNDNTAKQELPIQKKTNNTGLPDDLKAGIENLSGYSMDDAKVHYNSDKPIQLNASAYVQGTDIHIAPGEEKQLPHEAWHVVQQKQGRVKPTVQMKGGVNVNDDAGLEQEADIMGERAFQFVTNRLQAEHSFQLETSNKIQLGKSKFSGSKIPHLKHEETPPSTVMQMRWDKTKKGYKWNEVIDGVIWYSTNEGLLYYEIIDGNDKYKEFEGARKSWDEWKELFGNTELSKEELIKLIISESDDIETSKENLKQQFPADNDLIDDAISANKYDPLMIAPSAQDSVKAIESFTTLKEFTDYITSVVKAWGIAPLEVIWLNIENKVTFPLKDNTTKDTLEKAIQTTRKQFMEDNAETDTLIPPAKYDPHNRLRPEYKANIGKTARHKEWLEIKGRRERQLVLGTGASSNPDGYANFGKDYGIWDYESWATWNTKDTPKTGTVGKDTDPNQGADVSKLLLGKEDDGQKDIIDYLHFRLHNVFPEIPNLKEKFIIGIALFNYRNFDESCEKIFKKIPLNDLWTLAELNDLFCNYKQLAPKTAFYGVDNELIELAEILNEDTHASILEEVKKRMKIFRSTVEGISEALETDPKRQEKLKWIGKNFFLIPQGKDKVLKKVNAEIKD